MKKIKFTKISILLKKIKVILRRIGDFANRQKTVITGLCLVLLYIEFFSPLFQSLILEKVYAHLALESSIKNDWLFLFSLMLAPLVFSKKLTSLSNASLVRSNYPVLALFLLLYILHRTNLIESAWTFTSFRKISRLCYADVVVIYGLLVLFEAPIIHINAKPSKKSFGSLIEDDLYNLNHPTLKNGDPGIRDPNDIFKRQNYAKYIAGLITSQNTKKSFAIAIKGNWGSGKSVFLSQINEEVKDCIKLDFNPWISRNYKEVSVHFFNSIINKIKPYDSTLSKSLKNYYQSLVELDKDLSKGLLKTLGIFKNTDDVNDINSLKVEITKKLLESKYKIIVFIDDLDRAAVKEVLSVFKIIRNSFDFPNVYFLVAYDETYIKRILSKKTESPSRYLEKIFQFEIDLPTFPPKLLRKYFLDILLLYNGDDRSTLITTFNYLEQKNIIEFAVTGMRDITRFLNSFNHVYSRKSNEIDPIDFFLLEIIKLKNNHLYNQLRNSLTGISSVPYLTQERTADLNAAIYKLEQPLQFSLDDFRIYAPNEDQFYHVILRELFNRTEAIIPEKYLRLRSNSIRYFSDDLFDKVSFSDFDAFKDNEFRRSELLINRIFDKNPRNNDEEDSLVALMERVSFLQYDPRIANIYLGFLQIGNKTKEYSTFAAYAAVAFPNIAPFGEPELLSDASIEYLFSGHSDSWVTESLTLAYLAENKIGGLNSPYISDDQLKRILLLNLKKNEEQNKDGNDLGIFRIYDRINFHWPMPDSPDLHDARALILKYMKSHVSEILRIIIRPHDKKDHFIINERLVSALGIRIIEEFIFYENGYQNQIVFQTFFQRFEENDFRPIQFDFKRIEFSSDSTTRFLGSPDYPSLKPSASKEFTRKLSYSSKFPIFQHAKWISYQEQITLLEATKGGKYQFTKEIDLSDITESIKSAKMFVLVDDQLTATINGSKYENIASSFEVLSETDVSSSLNLAKNKIDFVVENSSFPPERVSNKPDNNPFEFIFTIAIEFENSLYHVARM